MCAIIRVEHGHAAVSLWLMHVPSCSLAIGPRHTLEELHLWNHTSGTTLEEPHFRNYTSGMIFEELYLRNHT